MFLYHVHYFAKLEAEELHFALIHILLFAFTDGWAKPLGTLCCCSLLYIGEHEISYKVMCFQQSASNKARQCLIQAHPYQISKAVLGEFFLILSVLFYAHFHFLFLYSLHYQQNCVTLLISPLRPIGTCLKCKHLQSSCHSLIHSSIAIKNEPVATSKIDKRQLVLEKLTKIPAHTHLPWQLTMSSCCHLLDPLFSVEANSYS